MLNPRRKPANRRGAMLVLIALTLPLVLIMVAFAVDVAWMQLVRTELRTATDAASRAGAKQLSLQQSKSAARRAAKDAAKRNLVAGKPLKVRSKEIVFGISRQTTPTSRFVFTPGGAQLNAVQVTGKRTAGSAGGPVALFLGHVMGVPHFQPTQIATSTQLDRDICLVVDRSGSMMRELNSNRIPGPGGSCDPPHPTRSRWGGLNTAVAGFVAELEKTIQSEQCGLVSYSSSGRACGNTFTTSDINARLDFSYVPIRDEMRRLSRRPVAGYTNIYAGIENGIAVLTGKRSRPYALRTMVVMTDGRHNRGTEPVVAARRAARKQITIHTVTFSNEADFSRMRAVAEATGGKHFHAPSAEALERIFREIAATLPVMLTQ